MSTGPNVEAYTQKQFIGNSNPDGVDVGINASAPMAFYGAVPLAQRAHTEIIASFAGITTATFTTSATSGSPQQSSAFTSQFGNWATLGSSVSGVSSTYTATAYSAGTPTTATTAQAALLNEIAITLVALGIWRAT